MSELTIGDLSERSGVATSALRFYEERGLIESRRTTGNQRRYSRATLRRVAFIRTAQRVGLTLEEVADALATLPEGRTPTKADWARLEPLVAAATRRADPPDRAAARPARRLHRLRVPQPAHLHADQPRRLAGPGRTGPGPAPALAVRSRGIACGSNSTTSDEVAGTVVAGREGRDLPRSGAVLADDQRDPEDGPDLRPVA